MRLMQLIFTRAVLLFLVFAGVACGPTLRPFTERLYQESGLEQDDLRQVQFYLSDDIILQRALTDGTTRVVHGEIKMVNGREVEEIRIRARTPGLLVFSPKEKRLGVSFDARSEDSYLMFGPNPKANNHYLLLASDWDRQSGTVTYEGKKWRVSNRSAYAGLMVDLKKIRRVSVKSRTATGRRI